MNKKLALGSLLVAVISAGCVEGSTPDRVPTVTVPPVRPPSVQQNVNLGDLCRPEGATGYTRDQTKVFCVKRSGETRPRWRRVR